MNNLNPKLLRNYIKNNDISIIELKSIINTIKEKIILLEIQIKNKYEINSNLKIIRLKNKFEKNYDNLINNKNEFILFKEYLIKKNNFINDILERENTILKNFKNEKMIKKKSLLVLQSELLTLSKNKSLNIKFNFNKEKNLNDTLDQTFILETLNQNFGNEIQETRSSTIKFKN